MDIKDLLRISWVFVAVPLGFEASANDQNYASISVRLLHAVTGQPISGAEVLLVDRRELDPEDEDWANEHPHLAMGYEQHFQITDHSGQFLIPSEQLKNRFGLKILSPPGLMDVLIFADKLLENASKTVEIKIPQTQQARGRVVSEDGRPVSEGKVKLSYVTSTGAEGLPAATVLVVFDETVVTDSEGRFTLTKSWDSGSGTNIIGRIDLSFSHPQHLDMTQSFKANHLVLAQLSAGDFTIQAVPANTLKLTVLDESGTPLKEAFAYISIQDRETEKEYDADSNTYYFSVEVTDADGVAYLKYNEKLFQRLEVQHGDFVTYSTDDFEEIRDGDLTVTLHKGRDVEFTVQDKSGNPISDAFVFVNKNNGEFLVGYRTKDDGKVVLKNVPQYEVEFRVMKDLYKNVTGKLAQGITSQTVWLEQENYARVIARDKANGELIKDLVFELKKMTDENEEDLGQFYGFELRHFTKNINDREPDVSGEIRVVPGTTYKLSATSATYRTVEPVSFTAQEGVTTVELTLVRNSTVRVCVSDWQGRPAAEAKILVFERPYRLFESQFTYDSSDIIDRGPRRYLLDSGGCVDIPFSREKMTLLVSHPEGFAHAFVDTQHPDHNIGLLPWAQLSGRVLDNSGRLQARKFTVVATHNWSLGHTARSRQEYPHVEMSFSARVDSDGKYHLRRLPANTLIALEMLDHDDLMRSPFRGVNKLVKTLELAPGEQMTFDIPGLGAVVTGRVKLPNELKAVENEFKTELYIFPGHEPRYQLPENFHGLAYERQLEILNEQKKRIEEQHNNIWYMQGGGARIFDVHDGVFSSPIPLRGEHHIHLSATVRVPDVGGLGYSGYSLARKVVNVTVTDDQSINGHLPVDLGEVELTLTEYGRNYLYKDLPATRFTTLDGREFDLGALRGKYVLIDFWATWCRPCVEELPSLVKVYERFSRNPRFVMLGVSFDRDENALRDFLAEHKITWPQALISDREEREKIHQEWRFRGVPQIMLFGPDGKRIARDLRGGAVLQTVEKAMRMK